MIQLGTRWAYGATPPSRLTEDVVGIIRDVEVLALEEGGEGDADPRESMWTLTWLEGRPHATLEFITSTGVQYTVTVNSVTGAAEVLVTDDQAESDGWDD
ncbi:hypothetical protein [Naasia lichenicola]|uniref:PepSY domain-containing protein n=1 Tax=Naasia lichenicola TaxID=2565933 RepID=A0A4S4FHY5_9MICO|nr:hypothetical protein [Naasia lichenicola]THG28676.1 hypothetical protein E6C64_17975 [Naasia lichenicola]